MPDSRLDAIPAVLAQAKVEHRRLDDAFDVATNPEVIYCAAYQDGLMHASGRILYRLRSGEYSHQCEVAQQLVKYKSIRADNLRAGRHVDVAYIDGYMNGLVYLLAGNEARDHLPFYFVYGLADQPVNMTQYKKALRTAANRHKGAAALAERIVREKLGPGDALHHTPFLTWKAESE